MSVSRQAQPLELHYRAARDGTARTAVTTAAYRSLVARTLGSRCKMWPSDSRYFDQIAPRCGPVSSVVRAMARLFVERAAAPRFLPSVVHLGRLLWLDPPGHARCDR
jgi:hypothetical protein